MGNLYLITIYDLYFFINCILFIWHFTSFVTTYTNKYISVKLLCAFLHLHYKPPGLHLEQTYHNVMYKGDLLTAPLKWYLCSTLTFPPCEKSLIKNFGINFGGLKNSEDLKKSNSFVTAVLIIWVTYKFRERIIIPIRWQCPFKDRHYSLMGRCFNIGSL